MTPYTDSSKICRFDIQHLSHLDSIKETERNLSDNTGSKKGFVKEVSTPDGIILGYYNVFSQRNQEITLCNETPYFQLSFNILGSKQYKIKSSGKEALNLKSLQYNYLHLPKGDMCIEWQGNQKLESFELGVTEHFFNHILPESHPIHDRIEKLQKGSGDCALGKNNLPLRTECTAILYQMLNCPMTGHLKRLYIHAKTIELISLQLRQFEEVCNTHSYKEADKKLTKEEIERMYLAKEIVEKNHNQPCRLIDLAHSVGTNDTYLKKHFKIVFGTTVFAHLLQFKMEKAMQFLKDGYSISDVAGLTGYNRISHFSRAFKKHFGFPPNKVK
ncbi:helix-turn-helix domain-containing protein [Arachidicoccus ginsenosidimutans]|uniref:helix-turn-helix domain-containing protein n=1 Tax=Arachidicoccus sp. BS20 TaxID=1850526 RepID=UPI0012E77A98|nr:AraC family transcriptional regulator [Arachidicoccus sp. BS20]